jgi:phenylalanine ammonia-lyase
MVLRGDALSTDDVHAVAVGARRATLTDDVAVRQRLQDAQAVVQRAIAEGWRVYGVTSGFGGMSDVTIPPELASASQHNLLAFLATAAGPPLDRRHVRAAMLLRANVLLRGCSGVRLEIIERLIRYLDVDAVPIVRQLGSIGASGDLVPLATIGRAITGQGGPCQVDWQGETVSSHDVLARLGLSKLCLAPKEALAIVNGTSFSAAIAANCVYESRRLLGLTLGTNVMMLRALCGQQDPFAEFIHQCKPHPGQIWTAEVMRRLLDGNDQAAVKASPSEHLQDRYSLRCLPQYFGPIVEGVARVAHVVHTEMNSVTDNPLIDAQQQSFHQGGNFLGQYIGMAMDDLRRYLGLLAKHLDVQIAQLVSPEFNHGLPASLKGNTDLCYNMGLKGLQITGNSIMPLLTYYANPLVEHFPTHAEQYNQNINGLSWGAANLTWQSVRLFQQYTALALIFGVQSLDLRSHVENGHYDGRALLGTLAEPLYAAVYEAVDSKPGEDTPLIFNDADQLLETLLADLVESITSGGAPVSAVEPLIALFDQANLSC